MMQLCGIRHNSKFTCISYTEGDRRPLLNFVYATLHFEEPRRRARVSELVPDAGSHL